MNVKQAEDRIKLDILASLARSQKALVRIIENMADVSGASRPLSRKLLNNMETISRYQEALAARLCGVRFRARKSGRPGKAWLNKQARIG